MKAQISEVWNLLMLREVALSYNSLTLWVKTKSISDIVPVRGSSRSL